MIRALILRDLEIEFIYRPLLYHQLEYKNSIGCEKKGRARTVSRDKLYQVRWKSGLSIVIYTGFQLVSILIQLSCRRRRRCLKFRIGETKEEDFLAG